MGESMAIVDAYTPQVSVIGGILLEPKRMGETMLQLRDTDFSAKNCLVAWRAMCRLFREGKEIDPVLVKAELAGFDGVQAFLVDAMEAAPMASSFDAHVQALKRISAMEQFRALGEQLALAATLEEQMELASKITAITAQKQARERRDMAGMLRSFAARHETTVAPNYLPWPVTCLNDGLPVGPSRYLVIGGYPSDGKTALALEAAIAQAKKGYRVGFYSLETDNNDLEDRLMASLAGIDFHRIMYNKLGDTDWARYAMACQASDIPLEAIQAAGMSTDDIRADALAHRYDVVIIDYLQLVTPRYRARAARWEEVSDISQSLQQLAKTTGIIVIALSQLSRPNEDKNGRIKPPTMADLRESGQIEQDADAILLLYRLDRQDVRAPRFLDIAKNKMGTTGHFTLTFCGDIQHFQDAGPMPEPKPSLQKRMREAVQRATQHTEQLSMDDDPDFPF